MATPKSGRHSRKRRRPGAEPGVREEPAANGSPPWDGPAPRSAREALSPRPYVRHGARSGRSVGAPRTEVQRDTMLGAYGERPANPFGGVPVSEIAIFVGAIGAFYGLIASVPAALAVGLVACTLGVVEFSAREHFSGYRAHTTMLAAVPAIGAGIALIALLGGSLRRGPLLLVVVPVFIVCFWLLRKRFRVARQARIAKPPAP